MNIYKLTLPKSFTDRILSSTSTLRSWPEQCQAGGLKTKILICALKLTPTASAFCHHCKFIDLSSPCVVHMTNIYMQMRTTTKGCQMCVGFEDHNPRSFGL